MTKRVEVFRRKHPRFVYKSFKLVHKRNALTITFKFFIEPNIDFLPSLTIRNVSSSAISRVGEEALQNFAFHLGMAEIPSYWKATCSPQIIIEAAKLNEKQIRWWRDLFLRGMGQFFYENKIDVRQRNLLFIKSYPPSGFISFSRRVCRPLRNRYLVPVGGGKDSVVTMELLRKQKKAFNAFLVNPSKFARQVIRVAAIRKPIIVERKIDPLLLELNKRRYLNGHTPFTSVLSFLSVFCAVLFDYRHIAFSNEKSADEGNLRWQGMAINHQYSKSSEFEKKFRSYSRKYLTSNAHYFSILRRYGEYEISRMFVKYPQYFSVFSSCNRGLKFGKKWCGECPKCLFVYTTLYPFLERRRMRKIFGKDLFENKKLLPVMQALIDPQKPKPFECVGTKEENRNAFRLCFQKAEREGKIPYLLAKYGDYCNIR